MSSPTREAPGPKGRSGAATAGSYWLSSTPDARRRPPLKRGARVDVAVVGGGIVGVTCALLLARSGARVALLEAEVLGGGTSGATTAKVTSAHGLVYDELRRRVGDDRAAAYGHANEAALAWMRDLVASEDIACDWRGRDAYTYTTDERRTRKIEAEAQTARVLGLPATLTDDVPGPASALAAVRMSAQAEMHPRRYILELADRAEAAGCLIAEHTRVTGVDAAQRCVIVRTDRATLETDRVVLATQYPILDRSLHFARMHVTRSYIVGVRTAEPVPAMLYSADSPGRSLRSTPLPGGGELTMVGGEGHATGRETDTEARYAALAATARDWFGDAPLTHRWSAQDMTSADELPYAETILASGGRIWAVTGLRKWGMTLGTAAAHHVFACLADRLSPHALAFDHPRVPPVPALAQAAQENAGNGWRFTTGRLRPGPSPDDIEPGEGAVHGPPHRRVAAYRDDAGALHRLSAVCTHLGCEVRFNPAERSWDCPCHASRFDACTGRVLDGPAVRGLPPADR
ncbi:MAG: FAD-dependent oxidoreductase [Solirubrobacteraceae bacterium]